MGILAERVRIEVEKEGIIPQNQTGFRKGLGAIDNIYVLNYLVNRQVGRKKGGLIAMFVDFKAAFDLIDRIVLLVAMRERGIKRGLINKVEEILRETKSRVRVEGEIGENFWIGRRLRQGCSLSPILFNILIVDLEEKMRKVKWGGVRLGEERIYSLAYADNVVLVAEDEDEMKSMMERLERYIERKKLELNTRKTKTLRFRKGDGTMKKKVWKWKREVIEEVKEVKYLSYVFQKNEGQEAHIKNRIKKAAAVMGKV